MDDEPTAGDDEESPASDAGGASDERDDPADETETAPADAESPTEPAGAASGSADDDAASEAVDEPAAETTAETDSGRAAVNNAAEIGDAADAAEPAGEPDIPADVRKYERFTKMDGAQYDRVNEFLRDRTYVTAREWAIARLCADFRTETGVEMTKIGENLPRLVPFMTDTYTPQAVNQARDSFEGKVTKAGATFLYGAMSGFFTAEELDDLMYEVTEIAKFLLEVEGVDLSVAEELDAEERISSVMRDVRQQSAELRSEEVECPNCGHTHAPDSPE